jgi:predicted amidohydrolase YtcJ
MRKVSWVAKRKAITNARVYTGKGRLIDRGFIVWRGSMIEETGQARDLVRASDLEIMDLDGKLVLPGLTDSHLHLVGYARSLIRVDLADTTSLEEGLERLRVTAQDLPPGAWLRGRGWDKQRWCLDGFPNRSMLDSAVPDHPVALWSRDGHVMWLNSLALKELGLDSTIPHIDGGEIEVDQGGDPTGILKESAAGLVPSEVGDEDLGCLTGAVELACRRLTALGLTSIHSVESQHDAGPLDMALEAGKVPLDLFRMREVTDPADIEALASSGGAECIKLYADGALGSQSASMLEPYCRDSENLGISTRTKGELERIIRSGVDRGLSVAIHAIGDKANRDVLDAYEAVVGDRPPAGLALRVEHAQVLHPQDIPRFARLGVIASMQPVHVVSDMDVADTYWGPRCEYAYAWKSIARTGAILAFGSDAPIEDPDPLRGIHAAATRRDPSRPERAAWRPGECLTVMEAVDSYTAGAAAAAARSGQVGRIEPGLRANLTVLDRDVLTGSDPDVVLDTAVHMTVIGGEVSLIE